MDVHLFMDCFDGFGRQDSGEQLLEMGRFRGIYAEESRIFGNFGRMHKGSISMEV